MIRKQEVLQDVVIKFAGDSGDGMQLTGGQFTNNTALLGIDLATFPDFPAEIRAPRGTQRSYPRDKGKRPRQKYVRPGLPVLDVQPGYGQHHPVPERQIRKETR